jgi:hypothetical protein
MILTLLEEHEICMEKSQTYITAYSEAVEKCKFRKLQAIKLARKTLKNMLFREFLET